MTVLKIIEYKTFDFSYNTAHCIPKNKIVIINRNETYKQQQNSPSSSLNTVSHSKCSKKNFFLPLTLNLLLFIFSEETQKHHI